MDVPVMIYATGEFWMNVLVHRHGDMHLLSVHLRHDALIKLGFSFPICSLDCQFGFPSPFTWKPLCLIPCDLQCGFLNSGLWRLIYVFLLSHGTNLPVKNRRSNLIDLATTTSIYPEFFITKQQRCRIILQ
ncbi:hypothetical protein PVAP13_9KG266000 [Panicum virgatum]|uniref:Uncharacterized protein n=1 Tax=Panicum virgatum TaxID=38727 RepID=A0A8T0NMA2_PANVG|nr:hypothetical protein PVAP13_9KG266000 [Panicum virgatum]